MDTRKVTTLSNKLLKHNELNFKINITTVKNMFSVIIKNNNNNFNLWNTSLTFWYARNNFHDVSYEWIIYIYKNLTEKSKNNQPKRTGQPLLVPRICSMPRISETTRPTATPNWLTTPNPPLRLSGDISEMYIGTKDVCKPET